MKKIVVLMLAVTAAIVANAASVKWTAANIYGSDGTTKYKGDATLYAYEVGKDAATAVAVSTFAMTTAGSVSQTFESGSLDGSKNYNFYYVIEDGGKQYTSALKENVSMFATQTATVAFGNQASATQNAANWVNVPEPTSAMLMILGIAGLALRRRRV